MRYGQASKNLQRHKAIYTPYCWTRPKEGFTYEVLEDEAVLLFIIWVFFKCTSENLKHIKLWPPFELSH